MSKSATFRLCCCLSFLLLVVVAAIVSGIVLFTKAKCSDGYFKHGAVAADSETCSVIGRDILQQGGSAVDGAIAALLCTSLVNPQSMGLGGGSIFTVMDKMGNVKVITSREKVPRRTKADLLKSCPRSLQLLNGTDKRASSVCHVHISDRGGLSKHDLQITSTINHFFGSMVYSRRTGVILNNELADFCNGRGHLQAGEQPPSSMAPSILYSKSKKKLLLIGGSGGSMITTGVASALMNHLWFEKNLQEAISDPVLYVNTASQVVEVEKGFDETVIAKLKELGHSVGNMFYALNVVNAISREGSCISAMSDTRKMGKAVGY